MSLISRLMMRLRVRGLKEKPLIPAPPPKPMAKITHSAVKYRQPRAVRDRRKAQREARKTT